MTSKRARFPRRAWARNPSTAAVRNLGASSKLPTTTAALPYARATSALVIACDGADSSRLVTMLPRSIGAAYAMIATARDRGSARQRARGHSPPPLVLPDSALGLLPRRARRRPARRVHRRPRRGARLGGRVGRLTAKRGPYALSGDRRHGLPAVVRTAR